jgi:hypothetical protein
MRAALLGVSLLVAGCPAPPDTGEPFVAEGPVLVHAPPEGTVIEGDTVELLVSASDPDGVASVRLYHRLQGGEAWDWSDLAQGDGGWSVSLAVEDPGLEYYFKASDSGEPQAVSYLPEGAGAEPFALEVLVQALPLPFTESFEVEAGQDALRDLGWVDYEAGFRGYPWELSEPAYEGELCARHARGTGDPDDAMDDWLIAPALDFSTMDAIQLSWAQKGSSVELADHELWLSTGSRDPSLGDFELVATLAAPAEDWARSEVLDLSAWAGERVVWLAWRYQGADADTWSIDTVAVEGLGPELSATVLTSPDPVHPGDELTVEITVDNAVDALATDVAVQLYMDMGEGGVVDELLELGEVDPMGSATGELVFTLAESLPDNSRVPYSLTLSTDDRSWSQEHELLLGYASTAALDFTLDAASLIEISLGIGDPDQPTLEWTVCNCTLEAGEGSVEVDVTDLWSHLPPAAGAERWFARVLPNTSGTVDGFSLGFGEDLYEATVLPGLSSGVEVLVYVPEPPDPVVEVAQTFPSTVQPGAPSVVFNTLRLRNDGAATSGAVTATLSSDDPGLVLVDGGPVLVSAGDWAAGAATTLSGVFELSVSEDKLDSLPLQLVLTLEDEVERWELPIEVAVPWPVLRVVRVQVEDDDNGDGILDAGESATLDIEVANTGDQGTDGIARGSLVVLGSSTAAATVLSGEESFGMIDPDDSRSEEFSIELTAGADGDILDLQLEIRDGTATYTPAFQVVLGEPPWLAASAVDDAAGDAIDGYGFDWVNAWYRVDDGLFQLRCEATDTVDLGSVFLEGWGASSGAGYVLYQLVITGGSADLLGWPDYGSHSSIVTPTLSADGNELLVEWDPAAMDLSIDGFSMGFGAGWCGPPEYYCDHFPDGWGYPYESYSSGAWLDLEW